jgi:hypothetical protein
MFSVLRVGVIVGMAAGLAACGGGGDGGGAEVLEGKQTTYQVSGTLTFPNLATGQAAPPITVVNLSDNRAVTVNAAGNFTFDSLPTGRSLQLTVQPQPPGFACEVHNGNRPIESAPVSNIQVVCSAGDLSLSVSITGLGANNPGLVIRNTVTAGTSSTNDSRPIDNDGPITFTVANGAMYALSILMPHSHYVCTLRNPVGAEVTQVTGEMTARVQDITIACAAPVRVSVSGWSGTDSVSLSYQYTLVGGTSGSESIGLTSGQSHTFATRLPRNSTYSISASAPAHLNCAVTGVTSPIGINANQVNVNCTERTYTVGGNVTGLGASNGGSLRLSLRRNGVEVETLDIPSNVDSAGNINFAFTTGLTLNSEYSVGIAQENGTPRVHGVYECTLENTSGMIGTAPVSNVTVRCANRVRVTISGLPSGSGLELSNSYTTDVYNTVRTNDTLLSISSGDGQYAFSTPLQRGRLFTISASSEDPDYQCTMPAANQVVGTQAINVTIPCTRRLYQIRGNATGLVSSGLRLRREAVSGYPAEEITVGSGTTQAFAFTERLPTSATPYTLTKIAEPDDRICNFINGTTTTTAAINRADVTDIAITCTTPAPLTMVSSTPTNNATNVALSAPITITFSHPINPATVNSSTVTLTTPHGAHPATLSVNNNVVTATAQGKLMPSTVYTITVTSSVRGTGKEAMSAPPTQDFTTGSGWGSIHNLGFDTNGSNVQIGLASNGNGIATWDSYHEEIICELHPLYPLIDELICGVASVTTSINSVDFNSVNALWSLVQTIPLYPAPYSGVLSKLRVTSSGDAICVVPNAYNSMGDLYGVAESRRPVGQAWASPNNLWTAGTQPGPELDIALTQDGDAWLVTQEYLDSSYTPIINRRRLTAVPGNWNAGTWSTPTVLANPAQSPQIAIGPNGQALVAWQNTDLPGSPLYADQISAGGAGGNWNGPQQVGPASANSSITSHAVSVASDESGRASTVWLQQSGATKSVYAARSQSGGSWGAPQLLDTLPGEAGKPSIAHLINNNEIVVWHQSDGTRDNVYASLFANGVWGAPVALETFNEHARNPQVKADALGNAMVMWVQTEGTSSKVYANRYSAVLQTWGTPTVVENVPGQVWEVTFAIASNGDAVAVWKKDNAMRAARFQ